MHNLRIVHITDAASLEALFRYRHQIYVDDLGWFADMGGVLADEFDEYAYNYAAYWDNDEVIGSVRVVPDSPLGLPLERCFPLNGYRIDKRLAEISRLVVSSQYRGSRLALMLMKAAYERCVSLGMTHIALDTFVVKDTDTALYERMGFKQLGDAYRDPAYKCELEVLSLALDVASANAQLPDRHPGLHRFFTTPSAMIEHK